MPSPFGDIDKAAQAAMTATFGEGIRLVGMTGGDYSRSPDPARPEQAATAVVSDAPTSSDIQGQRRGSEFTGMTVISSVETEAWLDATQTASLLWHPTKGDVLIRDEMAGSPRYTVSAAYAGDYGDLTLTLTQGATAP